MSVTSLAAQVDVYRLRNEYALHVVTGDGVDTVGVWGSNPHAPTIPFNSFTPHNHVLRCSKTLLLASRPFSTWIFHAEITDRGLSRIENSKVFEPTVHFLPHQCQIRK